jgi:hypothetical protein
MQGKRGRKDGTSETACRMFGYQLSTHSPPHNIQPRTQLDGATWAVRSTHFWLPPQTAAGRSSQLQGIGVQTQRTTVVAFYAQCLKSRYIVRGQRFCENISAKLDVLDQKVEI